MAGIVPEDDLPEAEGPAPTLYSKDTRMQKTIADIEAGVPAPKVTWRGEEMPEYNAPSVDRAVPEDDLPQSNFPGITKITGPGLKAPGENEGLPTQEGKKGFLDTLRNPIDLWKNESMYAHLYKASEKGVFNKPVGELFKSAGEEVSKFSLEGLWDAAKENPRQFLGEMVNGIVADPEFLLFPAALGGRVAGAMGVAGSKIAPAIGRVARVAGQVAETGAMGAVGMAPISMARQLDEAGVIDTRTLMTEMKVGAAMGATMGIMFNLGGNALKVKPRKLYEDFKARTAKGATPDEAIETTLKNFGMKADDAAEYAAKTKEQWDIEYANSLHEAEVAKSKGLPEASKPSKKEIARVGRESKARIGEEAEGAAIAKGEAERIIAEKASTQELLDGIVNPPKTRLVEGVEIGSAKAAELTPPAQRSAEDLIRIRAERQKQPEISLEDFIATKPTPVDPKKILVPEEGKWKQLGDAETKAELQARGFDDPDFARMTALETIPLRREASRGLENLSPAGKMVSKMESGRQRLVQNVEAHRRLNEDLGAVIGQPQRAGDIYKKIAEQSPDPVQREIARVLRPRIHDIDVTVGSKYLDDWNINALASGRNPAEGLYNPKTQSIHIAADADAARVALHEGTHATTVLYMLRYPNAIETRMVKHLYETARDTLQARGIAVDKIYGLTNPMEFLAEAFSRPAFQQDIATIRLPKELMQLYRGKLGKNPTLWDAFVNTVSRIIFGTKKAIPDNVLAATLEVGADIIRKGGGKGERGRMLADLKAQELPSLASARPDQAGNIDPRLAKVLGMTGLAAGIGSFMADDPKEGAAIGAALAVGGMTAALAAKKVSSNALARLQQIAAKDNRYRIDGMRKTYQSTLAGMKIDTARISESIKKLVPDAARREELFWWIEKADPKFKPRTKEEAAAIDLLNKSQAAIGKLGQEKGVLKDLIEEGKYITHLFDLDKEGLQKAKAIYSSMSPESRFSQHRKAPNIDIMLNAGFKLRTTDIAEVFQIYGESMAKSVANAGFLDALKKGVHPEGRMLIMPGKKAPADYVSIPHPQLQAVKVHPDIAPSLGLIFTMDNPNAITQKLLEFSALTKRTLFSFSMFHAMALTEAALAAQPGATPLHAIAKGAKVVGTAWGNALTGKHWLQGELGKQAEMAAKAGVVLEPKHGVDVEAEIFQNLLKKVIGDSEKWLSPGRAKLAAAGAGIGAFYADEGETLEGAAVGAALGFGAGRLSVKGAKVIDAKINDLLWNRLHPTFKILTYMNWKEKFLAENAKLAEAGKPTYTPAQIDEFIASFVNDTFGGLDWVSIAEGVQNRFGRDIAMALASPAGRRGLSIAFLAPDWGASTFRSVIKAVPGATDKEIGRMHRAYVGNSALLYLTFGTALNLMFSGKPLWENEDPTYIDLGDGRKMQLNKHFMETFHWIQRPGKTFSHKLGAIPRIAGKIAFDPFMNTPKALGKEIVSTMTPIPVSNVATQGEMGTNVLMGALGLPIYGKTDEQKARDQMEKKIRRQQLLLEKQLEAFQKGKK